MAKKSAKTRKADTFSVWGAPPAGLTKGLTPRQMAMLRQYTESVVSQCYRIAYDNGHVEGLAAIITLADKRLKSRLR